MKRVFGLFEVIFDILYLITALCIGIFLIYNSSNNISFISGIMAITLMVGDSFHLIPRIIVILKQDEKTYRVALGRGKQIASISMTIFYVLLWELGVLIYEPSYKVILSILLYILACIRIFLCFLPQNKWVDRYPPVKWGIIRNIPFFLQGLLVAYLYFIGMRSLPPLNLMWLAILLSFLFYIPVVLYVHKNPKIGMMMLPKTGAYIWILIMCLLFH